jgi:crotonobetaine/carnitine-CoA ligase
VPRTALFSGYQTGAERRSPFDADGWFATGDLGRVDDSGALVFIERKTESLRVSGEYVPISFVERHFAKANGVSDVAIWRELDRDGGSDRLVLFVVGPAIEIESLRLAAAELPKFMRPQRFVELDEIPRDPGVGKVRRRQLADRPIRHTWPSS